MTSKAMGNNQPNAGTSLSIENFDFSNSKDKGVIVVMTIDKKNCFENIDVAELNSTEIDNSCDCAACQHRKNIECRSIKTPAIFEGYLKNDVFLLRGSNGFKELATIKSTWQNADGLPWVTFISTERMGFLDMKLHDFQRKYMKKPTPETASQAIKNTEAVGSTRASDERRFFYITFSYFIGGKRGHRKGFISHRTFNNEMFNIELVSKEIKIALLGNKIKSKNILIEHWQEVSRNEYVQLMRENK